MSSNDYDRSISLLCSTCGNAEFNYDGDQGPVTCGSCGRVFTREELIKENGAIIEGELHQMKSEIVKDVRREFRDAMKNAFKGSEHIKFK